jgi:hypothetical protein
MVFARCVKDIPFADIDSFTSCEEKIQDGGKTYARPQALECQLDSELHHAWPAHCIRDLAEVSAGIPDYAVGRSKIDIVQNVEDIPTQLQPYALAKLGALRQANVETLLGKATQNVPAQVAKAPIVRVTASERKG